MTGWWTDLTAGVAADLGNLSAGRGVQLVVRLLVAGVVAALVGRDRARAGKSAGLRTHILVAVGAAAFVAIPEQSGTGPDAVSRVLEGLIAGIGFLGAGCILNNPQDENVYGLTTAAGIWLTAAVGVAAGLGHLLSAVLVGAIGWFTLSVVGRWDQGQPNDKP